MNERRMMVRKIIYKYRASGVVGTNNKNLILIREKVGKTTK